MLRSNHCAADPDGGTWRQDVGEVLDQSLLPVTNFHYGFSGAQCFDDAYWVDSDHGTGNDGCASMLANPSWCADFGTYSEAASAACPVACGSCHIDPFKVTPEPTSDPTTIPHWVSHAPLSSPPSTPLALTSPSPSPSPSPVVVGKGDFDAHPCAQHHCTNTCSHSTLFLRHRPGNCGGE